MSCFSSLQQNSLSKHGCATLLCLAEPVEVSAMEAADYLGQGSSSALRTAGSEAGSDKLGLADEADATVTATVMSANGQSWSNAAPLEVQDLAAGVHSHCPQQCAICLAMPNSHAPRDRLLALDTWLPVETLLCLDKSWYFSH